MVSSKDFCQSIVQHLNQLGPVNSRAMFGGYGLYLEGIMFALIAYDVLYFKVGDTNHDDYVEDRLAREVQRLHSYRRAKKLISCLVQMAFVPVAETKGQNDGI